MGWIRDHLLIREDRIRAAVRFRVCIGLIAVVLACAACQQGYGGGTATFAGTFMGGLHLMIFSLLALRWSRERGMWMMYTLATVLALFMYSIGLQSSPPAPAASSAHTAASIQDAAIGGCLFIMNVRLQVSAAVANFRRFREKPGSAEQPRA